MKSIRSVFLLAIFFSVIFFCGARNVLAYDITPLDLNANGIPDSGEAEVIVTSNATLPAGEYSFYNLIITNNATLTAEGDPNSTNAFKGVKINAVNLTITTGSAISADRKGYGSRSGIGTPTDNLYQAGASYGGVGNGNTATSTYGSALVPIDLGSGSPYNGNGGGAIRLTVTSALTNNGTISADGAGSSSGGSIYVETGNLAGIGIFRANGGGYSSSAVYIGQGGGGRVAIYYRSSSFTGQAAARGGCGSLGMGYSYVCAGDGTTGFFDTMNNDFLADTSWRFQKNDGPFNFDKIILTNGAKVETEENVDITANELLVDNASSLTLSNGQISTIPKIILDEGSTLILSGGETLTVNSLTVTGTSTVTVVLGHVLYLSIPNITITSGSAISADQKGYIYGTGPGAPTADIYYAGASYGGVGWANTATSTYGSEREPTDFGSSGNGYHPYGGGAIHLVVSGNFVNNGIISADGSNTSSGGSIYATTNNLIGDGVFRTNGGDNYCPNICLGPGGGGRVAIYYQNSSFTGSAESLGGLYCNYGCPRLGGNGTVVMEQSAPPAPSCTVDCFSNVLFLPGLEASRLYKPDYNGGTENLWEPNGNDTSTRKLSMDVNGIAIRDDIYTEDVIDNAYLPIKGNVYKSFLEQLNTMKNTEKVIADYSVTPYDWRLSLDDILNNGAKYSNGRLYYLGPLGATSTPYIIQELRRLAKSSRTGKVTIVAHSNGGLVAKALTNKLGAEVEQLIDKIIFVAVPQTGTPEAVGAILHGFDQALPIKGLSLLGMSSETARELAQNMPSAYNLLPSTQYFNYISDPVISFDNDPLLALWRVKYGIEINTEEKLHNFLVDESRITLPTTVDIKSPNIGNSILLNRAELVHSDLDNWTLPTGITLTEIAGWGEDTLATIVYYQGTKMVCDIPGDIFTCHKTPSLEYKPKMVIDGDGTVVVPSALWTKKSTGEGKYWVDLDGYNKGPTIDRKHADILEVSQLRSFIQNIITEKSLDILPQYISISTPAKAISRTRLQFTLHSPLSIDLYDDLGNHTGFSTTTNSLEENIPDSQFLTFGEVSYVSVPESSNIHLYMNGHATGSFTLDLEEVQGDTTISSTTFSGIPSLAGTLVSMNIPQNTGIEGASDLRVDLTGDGTKDISFAPKLNEIVTLDTTPPTTTTTIAGTKGTNNWYTSNVTVTLSATDTESGVAMTSYSTSTTGTINTYSAPFVISAEGTTTLQYFSIDNQGNREAISTLIIKIDKTAPDAKISIDSSTKDLKVEGVDNLSKTIVSKDSNNYTITDEAGHITKLLFQKTFTGKLLTYAKFTGVKYDSNSIITLPTSSFVYLWNSLVNPPILLSQTIVVNDTYTIEAVYDKNKNQTTVFLKKKGTVIQKQVFSGLHVVKLTVSKGVVGYEL